jgi:putative transposase
VTVELVFDPFDLTQIQVRYQGRPMGQGVPAKIGQHVHPKARPEVAATPTPATGIDYLALVQTRHDQQTHRRIAYVDLPLPGLEHTQPTTDPGEQQ